MGSFKMNLGNYKDVAENPYKKNKAMLLVDGHEYNSDDYSNALAEYVKARTQRDELIKAKTKILDEVGILVAAKSFAVDDIKNNVRVDEAKKSIKDNEKQVAEVDKQVKQYDDSIAKLEHKMGILKSNITNFNGDAVRFLKKGVRSNNKLQLKLSNEKFLEYLAMIEMPNVTVNGEEDVKALDAMQTKLRDDLAEDFDTLFPQFVGSEQAERGLDSKIHPLFLVLINGKTIDEYTYDGIGRVRPGADKGQPDNLYQLVGKEAEVKLMKAKFMAALVSGKEDVRIMQIDEASNNFQLLDPKPIRVDVSEYKNLEKHWIEENKKNFFEKRDQICVPNGPVVVTKEQLNNEAKRDKKFKKLNDAEKKAYLENLEKQHLQRYNDDVNKNLKSNMKELNKRIANTWSSKSLQLMELMKKYEEESKATKSEILSSKSFVSNSNQIYDDVGYTRAFTLKPMDEDSKMDIESYVRDIRSANTKYNPNMSLDRVITYMLVKYNVLMNEAQEALKIYGITSKYNKIYGAGYVFKKSDATKRILESHEARFEEALKQEDIANDRLYHYISANLSMIAEISRMCDTIQNTKIGSYVTMDGILAADAPGATDKRAPLNPKVLSPEERNEYYKLTHDLQQKLAASKKSVLELYKFINGPAVIKSKNFLDAVNRFKSEFDINEISSMYNRIQVLCGKMLFKCNNLEVEPNANIQRAGDGYDQAQSKLYYHYMNMKYFAGSIVGELLNDKSYLAKARAEENARIEELKAKGIENLTEEERYFIENSIENKINRLSQTIMEYEDLRCNKNMMKNYMEEHAYEDIQELDKKARLEYKANHDEVYVKEAMLLEQQMNQQKAKKSKKIVEEVELDDEALTNLVENAFLLNNEKIIKDSSKVKGFKDRYDKLMDQQEKMLTGADKAQISQNLNAYIAGEIPSELRNRIKTTKFDSVADVEGFINAYQNDIKTELTRIETERKEVQDQVNMKEEEIRTVEYRIDAIGDLQEYWENRLARCKELNEKNEVSKNTAMALQSMSVELDTARKKVDVQTKTAEKFTTELKQVTDVLDPNQTWFAAQSINAIKGLVYNRSALDVENINWGKVDNTEERKAFVNRMNEDKGGFHFAQGLEVAETVSLTEPDKHKPNHTMADYDKLSIDEFMELYQEVRADYDNDRTKFESDNPAMVARFNSIFHMMDKVDEERQNRQQLLEIAETSKNHYVEERNNLEEKAKELRASMDKSYKELEVLFNSYENELHDSPEAVKSKSVNSRISIFIDNIDNELALIEGSFHDAEKRLTELVKEIQSKKMELAQLQERQEKVNAPTKEEQNLAELNKIKAQHGVITKTQTRNYITNKLSEKHKAKLVQTTDKKKLMTYEQRNQEMKAKYDKYKSGIPAKANEKSRGVIAKHSSADFVNAMGALYSMKDEMFSYKKNPNRLDSMKLLGKRREYVAKYYKNVVGSITKDKALKNAKFKLPTGKSITEKSLVMVNESIKQLGDNAKTMISKNCRGDVAGLFSKVYPDMHNYTMAYKHLEKLLVERNVKGFREEDVEKTIAEWNKERKNANISPDYKAKLDQIFKFVDDYKKAKGVGADTLLKAAMTGKPMFQEKELQVVEKLCTDIAKGEIDMIISSVEKPVLENMKQIDAASKQNNGVSAGI